MTFNPTEEYHLVHVQQHKVTYYEYLLSEAITLIADYINESREETIKFLFERYDDTDINSVVLQMITYMYANTSTQLDAANKWLYSK